MADQLNTISTTTTSILTTLQTLMRRSKDNASELDKLKNQVLASTERDSQTVDELKRLVSTSNSSTDLTALFSKLDSLRPTTPEESPSAHKLDEEKAMVDNILSNANQALADLLTLTEAINNLTTHLNTTSTRIKTEESQLEALMARKSPLEAESARLEATIHLRNLELAAFTKKAEILESRILRAKTAVQLSGSKHIKMKKSPLILGPGRTPTQVKETSPMPITPQRRILSLSSTTNKGSPARGMTEFSPRERKTSWSKRLGGMLSGLTSSNKENVGENTLSVKSGKTYVLTEVVGEKDVVGLGIPSSRGRSVSENTK
jgi:hypothetical protein